MLNFRQKFGKSGENMAVRYLKKMGASVD